MKSKLGFFGLERKVEREYEAKGVPHETARLWGIKTAGKAKAEKKRGRKRRAR